MTEIRKFTLKERISFGYTVAELRQIAREHGVHVTSRARHDELVAALDAAGIDLPMKPLERMRWKPQESSGSGSTGSSTPSR
jgi:hypothetical protein